MILIGKIDNNINNKEYVRVLLDTGNIAWYDWNEVIGDQCPPPQQTRLEQMFLENIIYKKAALYADLPYPFDREEEGYFQAHKLKVYDAYIAGHIAQFTELTCIPRIVLGYDDNKQEHTLIIEYGKNE